MNKALKISNLQTETVERADESTDNKTSYNSNMLSFKLVKIVKISGKYFLMSCDMPLCLTLRTNITGISIKYYGIPITAILATHVTDW